MFDGTPSGEEANCQVTCLAEGDLMSRGIENLYRHDASKSRYRYLGRQCLMPARCRSRYRRLYRLD